MALTATIKLHIEWLLTKMSALVTSRSPLAIDQSFVFTDGVGANQVKAAWSDKRTIAASASESLDLSGVLTDEFGVVVLLSKLKMLMIIADAGNVNDVVVGGAALNALSTPFGTAADKLKVKPGGMVLLVAPDANGYAVIAGTGDLLQVANSGGTTGVTYQIGVLGVV